MTIFQLQVMYITAPNCEDIKRQDKHSSYTIKAKNPSNQIFYDDIFITECTFPCSYISASEIITIKNMHFPVQPGFSEISIRCSLRQMLCNFTNPFNVKFSSMQTGLSALITFSMHCLMWNEEAAL